MASPYSKSTPVGGYSFWNVTTVPTSVNTTVALAISSGTQTVTPASMTGITVGMSLHIAANGGTAEDVVVTAVTGTTFTAVFASSHNTSTAVTTSTFFLVQPVGRCVATTSVTTITAGAGVVVTPTSMAGIVSGIWLDVNGGTGTAERVQVTAVTGTTFTANFVNNHSGAYLLSSVRGTYMGPLVVGNAGATAVLTLYDGHPNASVAGTKISTPALAVPGFYYSGIAHHGLFYTLTAGTPPDVTFHYMDDIQP